MGNIHRMRVTWSGTPVTGPGLSTFYFNDASMAGRPAAILTFLTALRNFVPAGVTITVPSAGDTIESSTGELTGGWTATGGGSTTGNGGAAIHLQGTGLRVRWQTGGVVGGRRVVGTTFIVPTTAQEVPGGLVQSTTVTSVNSACATLLSSQSPALCIWSRPTASRIGVVSTVTSGSCAAAMTWLRSRRT